MGLFLPHGGSAGENGGDVIFFIMAKKTLKDISLKGKRLLLRVDFNVPLDANQNITDDKRICDTLPTIQYTISQGAKVILISHLGRPKGNFVPGLSLKPVAKRLSELLDKPVAFADDCIGTDVEKQIAAMVDRDVLLLENLRFHKEETENDSAFSEVLSRLGDVYANDAFGSAHRAHSSTEGVTKYMTMCVSGFLMEKEISFLDEAISDPKRPFVALLGGEKVRDKIPIIENLLDKVDRILVGGGMMFTFFKAMGYEIGNSLLDEEHLDSVKRLIETQSQKLVLPKDCLVADSFSFDTRQIGMTWMVPVDDIPPKNTGLDIGPCTIESFSQECRKAGTIVWNGPMGVFEIDQAAKGTLAMARILAECTDKGATTIIGGGDSASAVKIAGVADRMSHVSTGGGASLEFLQGKILPGVAALTNA